MKYWQLKYDTEILLDTMATPGKQQMHFITKGDSTGQLQM